MPQTKAELLLLHSNLLAATRDFFKQGNFVEVVAKALQSSLPLEPTIYPFYTTWSGGGQAQVNWLSTSPEKILKAALAAGLDSCYAISSSFRDLEQAGPIHKPEFLMLEWYRSNSSLTEIMVDVKNLVQKLEVEVRTLTKIKPKLDLANWQTLSLAEEFEKLTGDSLSSKMTDVSMQTFAKSRGYEIRGATWEQLFNQWFLNDLEPKIGQKPTFLIDFPARISPLCQKQSTRPFLAERFEVYLSGIEIGNGNQEKTNSAEVRQAFKLEQKLRLSHGLAAPEIDEEFLASLDQLSGRKIAGIGLGLERLWMILTGADHI